MNKRETGCSGQIFRTFKNRSIVEHRARHTRAYTFSCCELDVVFTANNKSLSKAHAASPFSVFFPLTYNERSNYSLRARRFTEGEKAGLNSAMRHFVRAIKTVEISLAK